MDQDDQTNLPPGLAWVSKNMQFSLTSARTRDGVNASIQGPNKSPITGLLGLVYQPAAVTEKIFQRPLGFDMTGAVWAEYNVGAGKSQPVPPNNLLSLPQNAHMIGVQAYNKGWLAFSDLLTPKYQMAVYNMKTDTLDPYGMKPFGWVWQANTNVVVGEVSTPTVLGGNGHTYRCIQAGITGAAEPIWPLVEGGQIADGTATWQELTPVLASALPSPGLAPLAQANGGAIAAGQDVYVMFTIVNTVGESLPAVAAMATTDAFHNAVLVSNPTLAALPGWVRGLFAPYAPTQWNLYVAIVAHGSPAPAPATFQLFASVASPGGGTTLVTGAGAGAAPPVANGARVTAAGNIKADSPTGGPNNTQGFRYAAIQFLNRNNSASGFTSNSVFKVAVDQNGFQLGIFNVPVGPSNTTARQISLTAADGTPVGPFLFIGDPIVGQPGYFVYPNTTLPVDGVAQRATIFGDNVLTLGVLNFEDTYLISNTFNATTDRLRVIWPNQAVDVFYDENTDRMYQTGAPGFNGHWISLKGDLESYYGDTGFIPVQGPESAICVRSYRGTLYSMRELSGWAITPGDGDPSTWPKPVRRWSKKGPCGPRAIDVCDEFMIFVHRSGLYRFVDTEAELVSKEVPKLWKRINWRMQHVICCRIDEESKTVRILVPLGNSQQPNAEITISYLEGWNNPIHFSTFTQREISMDSARRYNVNDIQAYVMERVERNIPNPPALLVEGMEGIDETGADWYKSQWLYGSSGPDGLVNAITPGIWSDNGSGIKWEYETVSPQPGMQVSKCEGFSLNAKGLGQLIVSALAGRVMSNDWAPDGSPKKGKELHTVTPIFLKPDQDVGISRMFESHTNERWRLRFRGDGTPGSWADLKWACLYTIPVANAQARSQG